MKKFEFSLERMLNYYQSLLDKEKDALMKLYAEKAEAENQLQTCVTAFCCEGQKRAQKAADGVTMAELTLLNLGLESLSARQKQLEAQIALLEEALEAQRQTVLKLSQRVSGMEKLKDKQLEAHRHEEQKAEQERILEIVASKFMPV